MNPDTVVCIIEAMKVMNEIKAEVKGVITQVLIDNAKPVEFGQPFSKSARSNPGAGLIRVAFLNHLRRPSLAI